jgi:hypothetical protein
MQKTPPEIPLPRADDYSANRVLVVLVLLVAGLFALAWDLTPLESGGMGGRIGGALSLVGLDGLAETMARLVDGQFKLGMLTALAVLVVYGLLQSAGAAVDGGCLARVIGCKTVPDKGRGAALVSLLSGRPRGLCAALARESALALHFGFGRRQLLEPLRLGLWAFPVVGFIGTVVGISQAVKDLPLAMKDDAALSAVLDSLHLAFDTTFIGLVGSVVVMVQLYVLDARWTLNRELAKGLDGVRGTGALAPDAVGALSDLARESHNAPVTAEPGALQPGPTPAVIPLAPDSPED